jgi:hypothetical protein
MYHAAHHVESYRQRAGKLPQFLHPSWHESAEVEFLVKGEDYELIGRYQDFELRFQRGDDAELLLHGSTWGRSR